jgi:hypothetical protein
VLSLTYSSYGDTDGYKPRPDPESWRFVPTATGPNTIYMRATTAIDVNDPPVKYYFECIEDSTKSSGWVSDANYTAIGLTPSTTYSFRVRTCDNDGGDPNTQSRWSSTTPSATTDADTTPPVLRLDLNNSANNDDANTQTGFTKFILPDSGSEVNEVLIDIEGSLQSARREDPCGSMEMYDKFFGSVVPDPCWYSPKAGERIYRDFIYGADQSGVTITLWGLGVDRDCNITIWAYDACSTGDFNRVAEWYANGTYIFDTNFIGGTAGYPMYDNQVVGSTQGWIDLYKYAWSGRATTDELGRIVLTSSRGPSSPEDEPFAFVNAIKVEPNVLIPYVPTPYAHRPVPVDGAEDVTIDTALSWRAGGLAATHDVYFGTDEAAVTDANRINPLGVLASQGQEPNSFDPYGATGFLNLDTTYYWRIDEVNDANIWKGDVWSFRTEKCIVVENFDSYVTNPDLREVWKDYYTQDPPLTSAEVFVENFKVRSGKSMDYWFRNNSYEPYYSEVRADINTARPNGLGLDPNWLRIGAKSLVLWFYGDLGNDPCEPMYVKLTDGDDVNATVVYDGDMDDITEPWWHEWNIDLQDFADGGVDLSDVNTLTIGIGDGTQAANDGVVWIEDIHLCMTRCALAKRSADFAEVDYAPYPCGNCIVDYQELEIMADEWLYTWLGWEPSPPPWPPSIPNLVAYWQMNEGEGDRIYTYPYDPDWTGIFSPSGVSWVMPGYVDSNAALRFDGEPGTRIICGNKNPAEPNGQITLSAWVKWFGPRYWDSFLMSRGQGIIGKRGGYGESYMMFELELDTNGTHGGFALRSYMVGVYSPSNLMLNHIGYWAHLAATYDGTASETACKLYLNGIEVASGPFSFSGGTDAYLTIGNTMDVNAWPDSPEAYYGDLDEVCIYNRALTEDEIVYLASYSDPNMRPIYEAANLYEDPCPLGWGCLQVINFKDFAVLANYWLEEELWP